MTLTDTNCPHVDGDNVCFQCALGEENIENDPLNLGSKNSCEHQSQGRCLTCILNDLDIEDETESF